MTDEVLVGDSTTLTLDHCAIEVMRHGDMTYECSCLDCGTTQPAYSMGAARGWGMEHGRRLHHWDWPDPSVTFGASDARSDDPTYREALRASRGAQERYEALRQYGSGATPDETAQAQQEMEIALRDVREMGHEWWLRVHRPEADDSPLPAEGFSAETLGIDMTNRPRVAKRDAALHSGAGPVECGARTEVGGRCRHPVTGTCCAAGHAAR